MRCLRQTVQPTSQTRSLKRLLRVRAISACRLRSHLLRSRPGCLMKNKPGGLNTSRIPNVIGTHKTPTRGHVVGTDCFSALTKSLVSSWGFSGMGKTLRCFGLLERNGATLEDWNVPPEMLQEPTDLYEIGTVAKPSFVVGGKMFLEISKSIIPSFASRDERTTNPVSWFGKTISVPIGPEFEVTMPGPVAWMLEMEMRNWWVFLDGLCADLTDRTTVHAARCTSGARRQRLCSSRVRVSILRQYASMIVSCAGRISRACRAS